MSSLPVALDNELAALVGASRRSLVRVENPRHGAGAGIVWDNAGLIVTNAHVAGGGAVRVLPPDDQSYDTRILAVDPSLDLAALVVEAQGLTPIPIGSSDNLRAGEFVLALGHPWGVVGAATAGVVIGVGDRLGEMPTRGREMIAVSLHLRPGHSGGALVNAAGMLVGLNTMMAGPDVGLAVPVGVVKAFVAQARSRDLRMAA